jgi:hypothetical protein
MSLTKELSEFIGVTSSSPFADAIGLGRYDYDDAIGVPGFLGGFQDRIVKAGTLDKIDSADLAFYRLCQRSNEIADEIGRPLTVADLEILLDRMVEEGLIPPQFS